MLPGLCFATVVALAHPATRAMPQPKVTAKKHRAVAPQRDRFPSVALFGAHVGEALAYKPRDDHGRARRDASRELERLLRCRQTGQHHRVAPLLAEALYQLGRHYEGHRLEIYSGYRPRAFCTRSQSRHMNGSAVDFHVEGVRNEDLIAYLRKTFHPSGVGYYPHGVHVHLDLDRGEDTYWIDPGPPVENAMKALPALPSAGTVTETAPTAPAILPQAPTEVEPDALSKSDNDSDADSDSEPDSDTDS